MKLKAENGGVTVFVTLFISTLLLFGSIGLVVDSGIIYLERRAVSNAAERCTSFSKGMY